MLSIEDLSYMIEIGREAMEYVRGGRSNLHKLGPTPTHTAADGLGAGYFLPEMEMDTGEPIYLPSQLLRPQMCNPCNPPIARI